MDAKISSYLFRYALMLINVLNNISPLRFDLSIILTFKGNKLMTDSQVKIFWQLIQVLSAINVKKIYSIHSVN